MNQKPIQTAICSYGMSGRVFHAPFLHAHAGFQLVGAFERSSKSFVGDYPYAKSFDSFEEMLAVESVELVVVNTPTNSHFEYAKKALSAGKHILVEKAFVITTEEAKELIEIANSKNVKIAVFQNRRFDSDFLTLKDVLYKGLVGEIKEAEFHFDRFNLELSPKQHKEVPGPGAGLVYDLGPHLIDQALYLFGMPTTVFADFAIMRPTSQVIDYFEILLQYSDKRVRLKSGYVFKETIPSFALHGLKGTFLKSRGDVQEVQLQAGKSPADADYGIEPESEQGLLHIITIHGVLRSNYETLPGNYLAYFDGVHNSIRKNAKMPVSGEDGLRVMQIIEAAYKSNETGTVIKL